MAALGKYLVMATADISNNSPPSQDCETQGKQMKVFGIAGYSNSGKTTLIEQLIPRAVARGLRVSLIKHAHHEFDIDHPGKDSFRHRKAGAAEVLVVSGKRWALMHELRGATEPPLDDLIAKLAPCDLVLVEGYKASTIPKLEVWRAENGKPRLPHDDPHIVALVTDSPAAADASRLPLLDLDDPDAVLAWILDYLAWPEDGAESLLRSAL